MKGNNLKLTVGQFAKAINRSPQFVSTYIQRGKLVKSGKYIDLEEPVNKLWLQSWTQKGNRFDIVPGNGNNHEPEKTTERHQEEQNQHKNSSFNLDKEKKEVEIKHIKARTRNEEIKHRKHSQNLITQEEAKYIFEYATRVFYENYLKNVGRILSKITDEVTLSQENYMDTRNNVENTLSEIHSETRKELLDGLQNLADQYSEVRGRGEQK